MDEAYRFEPSSSTAESIAVSQITLTTTTDMSGSSRSPFEPAANSSMPQAGSSSRRLVRGTEPLEVVEESAHRNRAVSANFTPEIYGTTVDEKHTNYVLMYDMLTGIRTSAKPLRPLTSRDFKSAQKLSFDLVGTEQTPSSRYDFKFKDYAPWVFRYLREASDIDAAEYLYVLSELYSPGKSGSLFYYSQDHQYIIKTIKQPEYEQLRRILPFYYEHIRANTSSLLVRFFGLHRLKLPRARKIYFVVMSNVLPSAVAISEIYDIKVHRLGRAFKGATAGRLAEDHVADPTNDRPVVLKDLNWINNKRKLKLGPRKGTLIVSQLKADCQLLARLRIMDYSLLIGIHGLADTFEADLARSRTRSAFRADAEGFMASLADDSPANETYYMGIIDILTPYSTLKKIEHAFKSLRYKADEISSVNPRQYALRFIAFFLKEVLQDSENTDYGTRNLPNIPSAHESDDEKQAVNVLLPDAP